MRARWSLFAAFVAVSLGGAFAGCKSGSAGGDASSSSTPTVTSTPDPSNVFYYRDVLPIVKSHCMPCHTSGGLSNPLDDLTTAQAFAPLMASRTAERSMPPWPPEPSCGQNYVGERLLSAADKAMIASWNAGGAKAGNIADAPTPTPTPAATPVASKILDPGSDFTYKTTDPGDYYYCFPVATNLSGDSDMVKAQIYPGNPSIVHHVILYKIPNGTVTAGSCGGVPSDGSHQAEFQVGWVPGAAPLTFPADTGMRWKPTDQIVLQIHYHGPPASDVVDRTTAAIWFSPTPVTNLAQVLWTGKGLFNIPPNTSAAMPYTATGTCSVPAGGATLLGVAPHMHVHGATFNVTQNNACLIDIAKWSFGWQGGYMFDTPKALAAGDQIKTTCGWFNDTNSAIHFGEGTAQEMCFDFMYVVGWGGGMTCGLP